MAASLWPFPAVPDDPEDAERSAQVRLFNVVALTAVAALVVAIAIQFAVGQAGLPMLVTAAALGAIGLMSALARLGRLKLASMLLPPLLLAACITVVVIRDGLHDAAVMALGAVLVMGGVLLQRRGLALFAAVTVAAVFAVGYAEINGVLRHRLSSYTDWRHVAGLSPVPAVHRGDRAHAHGQHGRESARRAAEARCARRELCAPPSPDRGAPGVGGALRQGYRDDGRGPRPARHGRQRAPVQPRRRADPRLLRAEIMRLGLTIGRPGAVRADGSRFPPEEWPVGITLRTGQSRTGVVMGLVRDSGSIHWLSVNSTALFADDSPKPYAVLTTFFDISGLKRAEQALRAHAGQLRHLSHRLFEVEENERRRLARELHDRIGANLTALSLNLKLVRGEWEKTSTRLDDSEKLLESTAQLVRDVLTDMRPPGLDELGLLAALGSTRSRSPSVAASRSRCTAPSRGRACHPRPRSRCSGWCRRR